MKHSLKALSNIIKSDIVMLLYVSQCFHSKISINQHKYFRIYLSDRYTM